MILRPIFHDALFIDPSSIFLFWAASGLKRRSRATRWWVLALTPVVLGLLALVLLLAIANGTKFMTITLGAIHIDNPAIWQVVAVLAVIAIVVIIPAAVLTSNRARRQFGVTPPAPDCPTH